MNEPHDPNRTIDVPSVPADSLDAGMAAGFGRAEAPRSSLPPSQRPVLLKEAEGESDHVVKPNSDAMPGRAEAGDRYQLFGEIARGGMGAILRGRDVDLGRDLAVKVLLEKHANRPEVARRFLEEAQIGGQLQHPNVVPVYDVGHFGERPYFTMKLVKGKTLAAILDGRAEPGEDRPRLLGIALQVSQAMAYAHAKGVIHRDLKPANIMVGAFGEVQVMDWGLAKPLAEGGVADEERAGRRHQPDAESLVRMARGIGTGHRTDTEAGSLLGTPAYMPPEQANGDVARLDRRCDVFGIGAILCEILTGRPPYVGRSGEEVRRKAANGDLADANARLDGCGADAELIDLTKTCLSPEAIDRPKDAQEVAEALSVYLNGVQERLQMAQRERAVALAREAEQRERRKVQLALSAALVALLLGSGVFVFWRNALAQAGRERDARNAQAVDALLGQCKAALEAGDADKAKVVLDAARKRLAEGGAEKEAQRLGRLATDLALLRELDEIDQFRWTWTKKGRPPNPAVVAARTWEALAKCGVDPDATWEDEAAVRVSASAVRRRIVSALDLLLRQQKKASVRTLLERVDANRFRDPVRDAVLANDMDEFRKLAGQQAALVQPPGFVAFLGESGAITETRRRQLLQAAVRQTPGNLHLLMTLGNSYTFNDDESGISATVADLLAAGVQPDARSPWLLALHSYRLSKYDGEPESAEKRVRWYQAAVAVAPANCAVHNSLGIALADKGESQEAIACFEKACTLHRRPAVPYYNLGIALDDKGQADDAIACYRKAIAFEPKLAPAHVNLGDALRRKGQMDKAIQCFRAALAANPDLVPAHVNLGSLLDVVKRDHDGAITHLRKAIDLASPEFDYLNFNLGNAYSHKGQRDEAIACYKKAIAADPEFAPPHNNLGYVLDEMGRRKEAIEAWREAVRLDPLLGETQFHLGKGLLLEGRPTEALGPLGEAAKLLPRQGRVVGRLSEAKRMAAAERRLPGLLSGEDHHPYSAKYRRVVAALCQRQERFVAAVRFWTEAFAADPKVIQNPKYAHRFNAAFDAAQAAAGKGLDASNLDDEQKARLRKQALSWLRDELAQRRTQLESDKPADRALATKRLESLQTDLRLASIRDKAALEKLPAQERKAFAQLWSDVAALLKKAKSPTKKESKR